LGVGNAYRKVRITPQLEANCQSAGLNKTSVLQIPGGASAYPLPNGCTNPAHMGVPMHNMCNGMHYHGTWQRLPQQVAQLQQNNNVTAPQHIVPTPGYSQQMMGVNPVYITPQPNLMPGQQRMQVGSVSESVLREIVSGQLASNSSEVVFKPLATKQWSGNRLVLLQHILQKKTRGIQF